VLSVKFLPNDSFDDTQVMFFALSRSMENIATRSATLGPHALSRSRTMNTRRSEQMVSSCFVQRQMTTGFCPSDRKKAGDKYDVFNAKIIYEDRLTFVKKEFKKYISEEDDLDAWAELCAGLLSVEPADRTTMDQAIEKISGLRPNLERESDD